MIISRPGAFDLIVERHDGRVVALEVKLAGTPDAIIGKLNRAMTEILKEPDIVENLQKQGFEPDPGSPQALTSRIAAEIPSMSPLRATGCCFMSALARSMNAPVSKGFVT